MSWLIRNIDYRKAEDIKALLLFLCVKREILFKSIT